MSSKTICEKCKNMHKIWKFLSLNFIILLILSYKLLFLKKNSIGFQLKLKAMNSIARTNKTSHSSHMHIILCSKANKKYSSKWKKNLRKCWEKKITVQIWWFEHIEPSTYSSWREEKKQFNPSKHNLFSLRILPFFAYFLPFSWSNFSFKNIFHFL